MELNIDIAGSLKSFKHLRGPPTEDWGPYHSFLEENYPDLIPIDTDNGSVDYKLDAEILNKIDVLSHLDRYQSPDTVWKGLQIAVCKMGYFGKYSRIALSIEESNFNYIFTFNEFMHIYPFLREMDHPVTSFDFTSSFKDYIAEKYNTNTQETVELIQQCTSFNNLIEPWKSIPGTPIYTCHLNCAIQSCPALAQISIDPVHELIFIKYINNHFNCFENHKRKIYDIVKKSFVRFGGDLEYINSLYVDMPRRYGIGFVESSLSTMSDKRKQLDGSSSSPPASSSWASTLKRRTMYDIQNKPKLDNTCNSPQFNLEDQPEWKVHISKNANGDLVDIYKLWREKYFQKQDFMWDSLSNVNWNEDFSLVKRYWSMAQLNGVNFIEKTKSMIIPKKLDGITDSDVWIIIEDESISSLTPLPKDLQIQNQSSGVQWNTNSNNSNSMFNQISSTGNLLNTSTGVESTGINLPGVLTVKRSSLTGYDNDLKFFRLINGENGVVAAFIISEGRHFWSNINKLLSNINPVRERIVLTTTTTIEHEKPANIKLYKLDFISCSSNSNSMLNLYFPPDVLRELNYCILNGDYKFGKVKDLIKSKSPRQRSHSIDPLDDSIQISSAFTPLGSKESIVRVANLTGTVRVSIKSMFKCLEEIENAILNGAEKTGALLEFEKAIQWSNTQLESIKSEVDLKYLKLIWLYQFQCNGNSIGVNKKIGFGDDLTDMKIGPPLRLKGRGILGLVSTLLKWEQEL